MTASAPMAGESDPILVPGACVLCGAFCFSLTGLFIKFANHHTATTSFSLLAIRSGIGLVLNLPATFFGSRRGSSATCTRSRDGGCNAGAGGSEVSWTWLAVRTIGGFCCVILEYMALQVLPLATNTMIVWTSPVFIVIWSAMLLGDPVQVPVIVCMCVCFLGLALIVQPWGYHHGAPLWAYAAAVSAAALGGLVYVALRKLKNLSYHFVLNVFMLGCLIGCTCVGPMLGEFPIPPFSSGAWPYLLGVGFAAYAAEVCITIGFARTTSEIVGQVSVLKFSSPIFSAVWGAVFLHSFPGAIELIGMLLVLVAASVVVLLRSRNHQTGEGNLNSELPSPSSPTCINLCVSEGRADDTSSESS